MRLHKFMDKNFESFRKLNIGVSEKKNTEHTEIIKEIQENFDIKDNITQDINNLNKELGKVYRGKYVFTLTENDINLDKIKINRNKRAHEKIVMKCLRANDKLSKMKTEAERKIREDI